MPPRLRRRLQHVAIRIEPPVHPQFRTFAADVIRFGGHEPSPVAIEQLARWYAGGYRSQPDPLVSCPSSP